MERPFSSFLFAVHLYREAWHIGVIAFMSSLAIKATSAAVSFIEILTRIATFLMASLMFFFQTLILHVEQSHDYFYDPNYKKADIFGEICNELNKQGFPCLPTECQRKWESLRVSYYKGILRCRLCLPLKSD